MSRRCCGRRTIVGWTRRSLRTWAGTRAEQGVPALRPGSLRSPGLRSVPPCSNSSTKGATKLNNAPSQGTPLGDIVRESGCPLTAGIQTS